MMDLALLESECRTRDTKAKCGWKCKTFTFEICYFSVRKDENKSR